MLPLWCITQHDSLVPSVVLRLYCSGCIIKYHSDFREILFKIMILCGVLKYQNKMLTQKQRNLTWNLISHLKTYLRCLTLPNVGINWKFCTKGAMIVYLKKKSDHTKISDCSRRYILKYMPTFFLLKVIFLVLF